jgi:hypothetical protein
MSKIDDIILAGLKQLRLGEDAPRNSASPVSAEITEEVLKKWEETKQREQARKQAQEDEWEKSRLAHDADPFAQKLRQASMAILDRVIERNQPQPAAHKTTGQVVPKVNAKSSSFGEKLKKLCEEGGLTPHELAKLTRLDRKLVWGHCNKGKGISFHNRKKYADFFTERLGRKISTDLRP